MLKEQNKHHLTKALRRPESNMKSIGLVAVPYDKGVGFCVMRKDIYKNKLSDTLDSNQFSKSEGTSDAIVLKIERDINKQLLAMRKKDEISAIRKSIRKSRIGQKV